MILNSDCTLEAPRELLRNVDGEALHWSDLIFLNLPMSLIKHIIFLYVLSA